MQFEDDIPIKITLNSLQLYDRVKLRYTVSWYIILFQLKRTSVTINISMIYL